MAKSEELSLHTGFHRAGLSHPEFWYAYVAMGGEGTPIELEAYVEGLLRPGSHEHDVIAHALNEHFAETGHDHPVGYTVQLPHRERPKDQ